MKEQNSKSTFGGYTSKVDAFRVDIQRDNVGAFIRAYLLCLVGSKVPYEDAAILVGEDQMSLVGMKADTAERTVDLVGLLAAG